MSALLSTSSLTPLLSTSEPPPYNFTSSSSSSSSSSPTSTPSSTPASSLHSSPKSHPLPLPSSGSIMAPQELEEYKSLLQISRITSSLEEFWNTFSASTVDTMGDCREGNDAKFVGDKFGSLIVLKDVKVRYSTSSLQFSFPSSPQPQTAIASPHSALSSPTTTPVILDSSRSNLHQVFDQTIGKSRIAQKLFLKPVWSSTSVTISSSIEAKGGSGYDFAGKKDGANNGHVGGYNFAGKDISSNKNSHVGGYNFAGKKSSPNNTSGSGFNFAGKKEKTTTTTMIPQVRFKVVFAEFKSEVSFFGDESFMNKFEKSLKTV